MDGDVWGELLTMKKITLVSLIILCLNTANCQTAVEVYQSTLKIPAVSEEIMHYGFHEGDKIVLNFEEVDGKELKEIEILEYPGISKFMDFKTINVTNKTLIVPRTGIYSFRFSNGAITGRVCSIKIERIPKDETSLNFNTSVYWRSVNDTTYKTIQEEYVSKIDTTYSDFYSSTPQISSQNAINGNPPSQVLTFDLPNNTVSWSFYIGTGNEGKAEFDRARTEFFKAAGKAMVAVPGYGPMAYLALTGLSYMNQVQGADNVKYYFLSSYNDALLFSSGQTFYQYKKGDVINEASQMKAPLSGRVYLALSNDNTIDPIHVTIKATAVIVTKTYATRPKEVMTIKSHEEAYLMN